MELYYKIRKISIPFFIGDSPKFHMVFPKVMNWRGDSKNEKVGKTTVYRWLNENDGNGMST